MFSRHRDNKDKDNKAKAGKDKDNRDKGELRVDLHTHLLPGMDDGSRDIAESLEMLDIMRQQGVDMVAATPHYINTLETIDNFISRRRLAFEELDAASREGEVKTRIFPRIIQGAEARFYAGMSQDEKVRELCIEGTDKLLLEMPFGIWTSAVVNETYKLTTVLGVVPIIAHVERYDIDGRNKERFVEIQEMGAIIQSNAEFFISRRTKTFALTMLERGYVDVVASDCHNIGERAPNLGDAADVIRGKLGKGMIDALNAYAGTLVPN
jgi:protein-tyrosine phosphatase